MNAIIKINAAGLAATVVYTLSVIYAAGLMSGAIMGRGGDSLFGPYSMDVACNARFDQSGWLLGV